VFCQFIHLSIPLRELGSSQRIFLSIGYRRNRIPKPVRDKTPTRPIRLIGLAVFGKPCGKGSGVGCGAGSTMITDISLGSLFGAQTGSHFGAHMLHAGCLASSRSRLLPYAANLFLLKCETSDCRTCRSATADVAMQEGEGADSGADHL
jgi:hypothetical protein